MQVEPTFIGYIVLFSLSALVCLATIPRALSITHDETREGMVGLLLSVAIWAGGYVGYLLAPSEALKIASYIIGFVFAFAAVGAFLYFCAAYTNRPPRQAPYRGGIAGGFLTVVVLKLTNPLHNLYFTSEPVTEPFPHLAINHGLLYWVTLGLSYAIIAVGFFMLFERFYRTGTDSRPLVMLAGVTAVPTGVTILSAEVDWLLPLMYEPPIVAIFSIGVLFVYLSRLESIRLLGESDDPTIYLDRESRVRDFNLGALDLLPALEGSIGTPIEEVSPSVARLLDSGGILTIPTEDEDRYFQVSRTSFTSGDVVTGQLVTVADVTDRETYRRQLEAKTEQLEALNRVVHHDIRNDMAVINGWAESLRNHVDPEGTEALDRVLDRSQHVIEFTETSREFVESLSDGTALELESVDLRTHLEGEIIAIREAGLPAEIRVDGPIPQVAVQANEMLSSVFRNLLENAVRHSDKETVEIVVSCTETQESVEVSIADNGPGIPDAQKEEVFGKDAKGLDSPGSGIGLYLVQSLVDQYEGSVTVQDNEPEGAVFTVELLKTD